MPESFQELIKNESIRLMADRKAIVVQQRDLENKLAEVDRELAAILAYELIKSGKTVNAPITPKPPPIRKPRAATKGRRVSKRDGILESLKGATEGLSRGEILVRMGLKGDKKSEMSVSNGLIGLTKSKQLAWKDGKYLIANA
jgi:hypothetical protein